MKPLFNNVVLKKELVNQTTNSGIVLTTKKEETKYATVVAVGNGILADGTKVEMPVKVGDKVKGWQQIEEVGTTGYSTGPHLHYQVSLNGSYIDGMSLIDFTSEDSSSYKPPLEKPSFGNNNGLDNFLDR